MLIGSLGLTVVVAAAVLLVPETPWTPWAPEAPRGGPAVSLCPTRETPVASPTDDDEPGPGPLWSDEFDAAAGTPIDPSRWFVETGGLGWGVGELQAYTDSPTNVAYNGDGQLVITARREAGAGGAEFTSGRLSTCGAFEFNHGRVEARIQIPRGTGLWPAFWLVGADHPWPQHGEIDILEAVNEMAQIDFNTHQPQSDGTDWELSNSSPRHPSGTWSGDYHVFAVDWTTDAITWSVDGVDYATITRDDTPDDGSWVVDSAPQTIVLNMAVGGNYPGPPDADSPFPSEMKVDWVRVYANDDTRVSYRAG